MNIIVAGCGKIGLTLAEQLIKEGHDVTIIDNNERVLRHAVEYLDVMGIQGNAAMLATQRQAGIENTDVLIAATNSDEINMLCCLIAKKQGKNCATIARIRDPEYTDEISYLRDELNLAMVINPEQEAAREAERLLRFPSAIKIDSFSRGRLDLIRVRIPEKSGIVGLKLYELGQTLKVNVLICSIERENRIFIPTGNDDIRQNDVISFIAKAKDAYHFFDQIGIEYSPIHSCMIVGGGRISYYIAKNIMETKLNIKVKILDIDSDRCNFLAGEFPNATIINGDGSDQELLRREGIENTDAFLSLTGFDEENIMLSLYAGKLSHARLITKINRIAFENVTNDMNLGSVLYPKKIVADSIVQYVRALQNSQGSNVITLYKIADGRAEALEFKVGDNPKIVNRTFAELNFKSNVLVGAIIRDQQVITPRGSDYLLPGDHVIIVTTNSGFKDLMDILA